MTSFDPEAIGAARTMLFVPGDRSERFPKAAASGADCIVLDLEDAVPPARKDTARRAVSRWLETEGAAVVRINSPGSPWYAADIAALGQRPQAIMLPKATAADQVAALVSKLPIGSCVIPLLETAAGVLQASAICASSAVVRVAFGNGDLAAQLGVDPADRTALLHARTSIVLASAAGGIAAPLDGVTTSIADDRALTEDVQHAIALGFSGKLCIHPRQIPIVHEGFTPSDEDLRWAHTVVAASGEHAITALDGAMVDAPVIARARRLLARAHPHPRE